MTVIDTFNGALTLNQRVFTEMRDAPDGVRRGFLVILMVGLLVGAIQSASDLISVADPEQAVDAFMAGYRQSIEQQIAAGPPPEQRAILQWIADSEEGIANIVRALLTAPTALPRPVVLVLQALAQTVSAPLIYLSNMLLAVILTHLAARQLGGQGGIQAMVAVGSLSVAPHVLDALTFVPILSLPLGLISWGWGLIVLITGTAVVHRLDSGKATLAVLLYPSLLIVLGVLFSCILIFLLISLAASLS